MVSHILGATAFIFPVFASRIASHAIESTEPVQSLSSVASWDDGVDWHFMTDQLSFAGRQTGASYDVVQGHSCQNTGWQDNSYFASSLCYWHPDTKHASPTSWGLRWRGGYRPSEWCGGMAKQSGVCAKCTLCHDNARDRDAKVDVVNSQVEVLPLPEGCLKESDIETMCLKVFADSQVEMTQEGIRCEEVQGRHDEAVSSADKAKKDIDNTDRAINQFIERIARGHVEVDRFRKEATVARHNARRARSVVQQQCVGFIRNRHGDNSDLVRDRPQCGEGESESDKLCQVCRSSVDDLGRNEIMFQRADEELSRSEQTVTGNQEQMRASRQHLAQSYQQLPYLTLAVEALQGEWLPQQVGCSHLYEALTSARNSYMMRCPRSHYDRSCEKACVEIQTQGDHGCGVVEGSEDGDAAAKGGVEATCNPPAPSWIMSPSNYGGDASPNQVEQCERITATQVVRRTTPVVLSGWMEKSCLHWCNYQRRFFVLESGNGVRSAALRYWNGDPSTNGVEHTNKGIELWDASDVRRSPNTTDWSSEPTKSCFDIDHHYRGRTTSWLRHPTTYTICVQQEDYIGSNMYEIRDMWVDTMQQMLIWQPRVA